MPTAVFTDVSGKVRLVGELIGGTLAEDVPHWTRVTLTSAQILALETTPVTLVAAPGSGKVLFPTWILFHYRPGATPYTGDATKITVGLGTSLAAIIGVGDINSLASATASSFAMTAFLAQITGAYAAVQGFTDFSAWLAAQWEDMPFAIAANDGVGMSAGDGTLTVSTLCSVLDVTATS